MSLSKRQKIGVTLILASAVAALVGQLVTGDMVAVTWAGNGTSFVIRVHDLALVLAVPALAGLLCLILPPRDKTKG